MGWAPLGFHDTCWFQTMSHYLVMLLLGEMIQLWHMCLQNQFAMQHETKFQVLRCSFDLTLWNFSLAPPQLNGWEAYVATTAGGIPNFSLCFPCLKHLRETRRITGASFLVDSTLEETFNFRYLLHIADCTTHLYKLYSKPLLYKDLGSLSSI